MSPVEAASFENAAFILQETRLAHPQRWRFPFEAYSAAEFEYEPAWNAAERKCRKDLNRRAAAWVRNPRAWPRLSPKTEYFFLLRFAAAARFLSQFPPEPTSILPFPDVPFAKFLRWILITWWASVGAREALLYLEAPREPSGPGLN
jgi:hypothetical protein